VLAAAGLDVVVLEAGEYYDDADFDGGEFDALTKLYDAAPAASSEGTIGFMMGATLGGGTVVNYSTSFRTPDGVREEWASHGVPAFASDEYGESLDAVCERLGVNLEHGAASSRDRKLEDGCRALGWHVDAMPRNVRGCDQGEECGRCAFGCRLGAKQSTAKTWLVDAASAGARIYVGARARRVLVENGAAHGVEAAAAEGGHTLTVRSRAVVASCGSLHTPALLRRSGLKNAHIGKHLRLHPVTALLGVYDEDIRGWEGGMQTRYSTQLADLDGEGHGVIYETGPMNPHLMLAFAPWRGAGHHFELMQALAQTVPLGILIRDTTEGEVKVGRDGEPVIKYVLNERDTRHMRTGIDGAAQIHEAAGALRIYSAHAALCEYRPGVAGSRGDFMDACDAAGYAPGRCAYGSFHIMGSARMGGSPQTSACGPQGETWDVQNLVIADASCFPSASGVNPMISIESIAHMNARRLAERLGAGTPQQSAAAA
jgi:choline dehydrogenase-like flavoprotein